MKPFDYVVPETLRAALDALDSPDGEARPIAGGQSLLLEMKERQRAPARLVALTGLPELRGWSTGDAGELIIGAGTSYASLAAASFAGWHGLVNRVAANLADRPVRTMGTIGGALCQADPRYDMLTLTVGLDAAFELASAQARRVMAADAMFAADGGLALTAGEILLNIRFPARECYTDAAFQKIRNRMFDAAVASAVCALTRDPDGVITAARLTIGAVAPAPIVVPDGAAELVGTRAGGVEIEAAAAAAVVALEARVTASSRLERYQRELVPVVVRRAINQALESDRSEPCRS